MSVTNISKATEPKIYYHGSFWEKPTSEEEIKDNCFLNLETSHSDLDVVYISDSLKTAEWFSSYNLSNKEEIQIVMKIEKSFNKTFEWQIGDERNIVLDGQEFDIINDREDVFQKLKKEYDAVIIKNNYPELDGGDDIACLDNIENEEIKEIKLLINNQWTDFMNPEKAVETIKNNFLKKEKKNKLKI